MATPLTCLAYLVIILLVADVRPFLGLRYDLKRVESLSQVIAPPYDVISPDRRAFYLQRSPYNIVRLEGVAGNLPRSAEAEEHTRAAALLSSWIQQGILQRESRPAFYLVEHRFVHQGRERSCWSLLGRVRLEDPGGGQIYLHEATSSEPVRDRLLLLRACQANLSPIIGLFEGEPTLPAQLAEVLSQPPIASAEENGLTCNLWVIVEENYLSQISAFFASKELYLADGHHRYEAALLYRQEVLSDGRSNQRDFVLMSLFNAADPGLLVLPVHRLVGGLSASQVAFLEEKLALYFWVQQLPSPSPATWLAKLEEEGQRTKAIGFYQPFSRKFALLIPRWDRLQELFCPNTPSLWRESELNLLHRVIFEELLGIKSGEEEQRLSYYTNGLRAIGQANERGELAFLLNPLRPAHIMALAQAHLRLPCKSSYFHPKTPAGLVINPLWE